MKTTNSGGSTKSLNRFVAGLCRFWSDLQSGKFDRRMMVAATLETVGFLLAALLTASVVSGCYALSGECIGGCKSTDASGAKDVVGAKDVGSAFADGKDSSDGKGLCYQDICGLEAKTQAMLKALPCLTSKKGCSYQEVNSEESKSFDFPPFAKEAPGKWDGMPGCSCEGGHSQFTLVWMEKDLFCPSTNWRVPGVEAGDSLCLESDGSLSLCKTHDKVCAGPEQKNGWAKGKFWHEDESLYVAFCWNDVFSSPCPPEDDGVKKKKVSN